jgi:uncharacterized membrane protein YfcA
VSTTTLLILSLVVLIAGFVQGTTGVGFALISAPVLSLLAPQLLPACLLLLMLPLNFFVLWRERGEVDKPGAGWISAGRLAGAAAGLWVLAALSPSQRSVFVGLATAGAALASLMMPAFSPNTPAYLAAGLVTGITETATGIGGPPLALVYQHQPPPRSRSTIAFCFLLGELVSLVLLAATGALKAVHVTVSLELLPALLVGMFLSQAVHHRVQTRLLRNFVIGFALVSGVLVLVR